MGSKLYVFSKDQPRSFYTVEQITRHIEYAQVEAMEALLELEIRYCHSYYGSALAHLRSSIELESDFVYRAMGLHLAQRSSNPSTSPAAFRSASGAWILSRFGIATVTRDYYRFLKRLWDCVKGRFYSKVAIN